MTHQYHDAFPPDARIRAIGELLARGTHRLHQQRREGICANPARASLDLPAHPSVNAPGAPRARAKEA
jgi:hypothetical protein